MTKGNGRRDELPPPKPLTIFWVSDGGHHSTGYGITTNHLTRRMVADGHRVFVYGPGGFYGGKIDLAPNLTLLSANFGDDRWGNQTLAQHLNGARPDVIITWLDCQGLSEYGWQEIPTFMWAPIDSWPVPSAERAILSRAERLFVPSRWGQSVLKEYHDIDSEYLPCGIDLDCYDIDAGAGEKWRKLLHPALDDDAFLIGMVGLNSGAPDRKGYGFAFDIIKEFHQRHPETRAYIHTNYHGDGMAINLQDLRFEMELMDVIYFSKPMGSVTPLPDYLRGAYNAFDVLLHCGNSEGFGLPIVEAQACGTPVVANACSAVTELLGPWSVGCEPMGDMLLQPCTRIALPSVQRMLDGLEVAYEHWQAGKVDKREVRSGVARFEQDALYDREWRAVLASVPAPLDYSAHGTRKLMLAAGQKQRDGFLHHDREKLWPHIEVAHDLNVFPWPWADESWDYIEFSDCLEHLRPSLTEVMDELWRILAPGGYVYIHTAEAGSWQLSMDPTHTQGFYMESLDYYDPERRYGQTYSYSDKKWRIVRKTNDNSGLSFVLQPRKAEVLALV